MSKLHVGLRENRTAFAPGDEIAGAVLWESGQAPESVELRLFWFTRGKGTEDVGVVQTVTFPAPLAGDTRPFSFSAPESPHSFSGKLVSLLWAMELILQPGDQCARYEIVIAPDRHEIILPQVHPPSPAARRLGSVRTKSRTL